MARYSIAYTSGATGYGWEEERRTKAETLGVIQELRHEYTAFVRVWDEKKQDFVFWKDTLTFKPSINNL